MIGRYFLGIYRMDFIFKFNEILLDFYSKYAPSTLQEPLLQSCFMQMVDICLVLMVFGAIYFPLRKYKDQKKREKVLVISLAVFANLLFISGIINSKNTYAVKFLTFIPLNLLFYFIYKSGDWLKKLNIETRLDGNLNLKKSSSKNYGIINCPSCNNKTISYRHSIREAQTCGECGKSFKAKISKTVETLLALLMVITFFLGFYLSTKCGFNGFINLTVMLSGFIVYFFYHLKPKKLLAVEELKK